MQLRDFFILNMKHDAGVAKHHKCKLTYDPFTGDYDCGYKTNLACEDCKYGCGGKKDPEAKVNTI
tara:strand:- start:12484 stop:12678 length:195 start_codon:yes stop_codon:yes gene_type:complete